MEAYAIHLLAFMVGVFFVLARFRFFYDPSEPPGLRVLPHKRHVSLAQKLRYCGFTRHAYGWAWYVALVEVIGGFALLIPGWPRLVAAVLLFGLMIPATLCTACDKVGEQCPVDQIDCVCAYLWRVEGLYIGMLFAIILGTLPTVI